MAVIDDDNRAIILASGSPRRFELMTGLGFVPEVIVSQVPERQRAGESSTDYTRRLAVAKAREVGERLADAPDQPDWILAADTVVVVDGDILEKPADSAHASAMLGRLSGRTHVVETSFCWFRRSTQRSSVRSVQATVEFRRLSDATIARYVSSGEPSDKAGAYGIQGVGGTLVRRIEGSYFTIVGLPIAEVIEELGDRGGLADFPFEPIIARQSEPKS